MLRVARNAVVVIEPHLGLAGRLLGTTWEQQGEAINYVFRWNRAILEQSTRSYLLSDSTEVIAMQLWDHNLVVGKMVNHLPPRTRLVAAKCLYKTPSPLSSFGNMMVESYLRNRHSFRRPLSLLSRRFLVPGLVTTNGASPLNVA